MKTMTEPTKMATMMMLTKVFHCWQLRHREHLVLRWTAHAPHFFDSQYCKTLCKQCIAVGQVMDHGDYYGDGDGEAPWVPLSAGMHRHDTSYDLVLILMTMTMVTMVMMMRPA